MYVRMYVYFFFYCATEGCNPPLIFFFRLISLMKKGNKEGRGGYDMWWPEMRGNIARYRYLQPYGEIKCLASIKKMPSSLASFVLALLIET